MLWECPTYDTIRSTFMEDLDKLLGGSFEEFSALNNFERTGFVLGCENWEKYDFKALLRLAKSFISLIWDTRKNKLYKYVRSLRSRKYLCVFNSLTLYRNEKYDLYVICM